MVLFVTTALPITIIGIRVCIVAVVIDTRNAHHIPQLFLDRQCIEVLINLHITPHIISMVSASTTDTFTRNSITLTLESIAPTA